MKLGTQSSARNVHNANLSAHRLACKAQPAKLCSQCLASKVQHANLSTQNSACGAQQSTYLKSINCSCSPCWGHAGLIYICGISAFLQTVNLSDSEVATKPKLDFVPSRGCSAKTDIKTDRFDFRCGLKKQKSRRKTGHFE